MGFLDVPSGILRPGTDLLSKNPAHLYFFLSLSLQSNHLLFRALKSKSFMPAGAVSILSLAMLTKYR